MTPLQLRKHEAYTRSREIVVFRSIRLPRDDYERLNRVAKLRDMSVNELIRTYVTWGLETDLTAPL